MLAGLHRWGDSEMPDKIGTVHCNSATCLELGCEYLLWGKLTKPTHVSPGSAMMTEPAQKSHGRESCHTLVGRWMGSLESDEYP